MSEKKTATSTRAPKTQTKKAPSASSAPSKMEKGIVIAVRPAFTLVKKADGSAIKVRGITAKVGDEIEI